MDASDSSSSEEELFVVESILARKKKGNKVFYLLKWEGYDETTWEPAENILDKKMLEEFDRKFLGARESQGKGKPPPAECDICETKRGTLFKCQKCSIHRHEKCIDDALLDGIGDDGKLSFTCDVCRADQFSCYVCRSSTEADATRLRCKHCHRIYHESCATDFDVNDNACYECSNYPDTVEQILTMRAANKDKGIVENEYLVKFETWSHRKCFWVPESWLNLISPQRLRNFQKDPVSLSEMEVIDENWCRVDCIMYEETSNTEPTKYLVKWRGLAPDMATWEDENSAGRFFLFNTIEIPHEEFLRALKHYKKGLKINRHWSPVDHTKHKFKQLEPDDVPVDCQLMQYQLEGVNWMLYNWHKGQNCLLADEMGLGKTVQTITLIEHLRTSYGMFPVLVIAPSTVCENWINEMNRWSPKIYHVLYGGMQESRNRLVEYELFNDQMELGQTDRRKNLIKNHVLVTSFQTLSRDCSILKSIPWQMIVVDEAHRLKGTGNLLSRQLEGFKTCFRLLLTGTPLQNNITELFNIMSFLSPDQFGDVEELNRRFEDLGAEKDKVKELHELLRPRILRRTKKEVGLDESIPPKREIMVPVSMSSPQMAIYKSIIEKNYQVLANIGSGGNKKVSLVNIWMELRKCVNHAYLIVDEPAAASPKETLEQLLGMSGKLELLDKILDKLKAQGHRVLIFSQMTRMLDIIQDFLDLKGYTFGRLDGQTPVDKRQSMISEFNNHESKTFCFLLSTRAGGLGINLTSADTVIIFDHDYNPHNDLQALCRAHRIGQKNVLHIYRLVTVNSIEESIVAVAKKKLVLDHVVVESMNSMNQSDIASILKMGVQKLFGGETPQRITYDEAALDMLLDRSRPLETPATTPTGGDDSMKNSAEDISIFKEEVFSHARVWEEDGQPSDEAPKNDAQFWRQFIQKKESSPKKQYGKGHRRRTKVDFSETPPLEVPDESEDSSWEAQESSTNSSESSAISSTKDNMSMLLGLPEEPKKPAMTTDGPSAAPSIPKLKLPVKAMAPTEGATPGIPPIGNDYESVQRIAAILHRVIPIPSTPEHLFEMVSKSPLLMPEQRKFLLAILPTYLYSTLDPMHNVPDTLSVDPLEVPLPHMAFKPHALFGLVMMELKGEPGVFSLFLLKPSKLLFSVFIPGDLLPPRSSQSTEQTRPKSTSPPLNTTTSATSSTQATTTAPAITSSASAVVASAQKSPVMRPVRGPAAAQPTSLIAPPATSTSPVGVILRPPLGPKGNVTVETVASIRPSPRIVGVATDQPKAVIVNARPSAASGPKPDMVTSSLNVNPAVAQPVPVKRAKPVDPSTPVLKKAKLEVDLTASPQPKPTAPVQPVLTRSALPSAPQLTPAVPKPGTLKQTLMPFTRSSVKAAEQKSEEKVNEAISSLYQSLQRDLSRKAAAPNLPQSLSDSAKSLLSSRPPSIASSAEGLPSMDSARRVSISSSLASELEQKIKQLETELRQSKSKEALLITQAAQLKRLAEENQRLKRENDLFRSINSSAARPTLSSSSSGAISSSGIVSPAASGTRPSRDEFMSAPDGQRFLCAWSGCSHVASSKYVLRDHVKSAHLEPLLPESS